MKLLVFVLFLLCSVPSAWTAENPEKFGCRNQYNEFVDWWVIYKEPSGLRYVYMDSSLPEPKGLGYEYTRNEPSADAKARRQSSHINNINYSPILHTISSAEYIPPEIQNPDIAYLSWNDQPKKNRSHGKNIAHSKGFLGMKHSNIGVVESFFIQHSLPRFPQVNPKSYAKIFDTNIDVKAQHFVCVSMRDEFQETSVEPTTSAEFLNQYQGTNFFKLMRLYLMPIQARVHRKMQNDSYFGKIFVKNQKVPLEEGSPSFFTIQSTGVEENNHLKFQIFAKTPNNHIDIYDDVTAALSIHHEDYSAGQQLKTGHKNNKSAMLMIAQSHSDMATLGINLRTLVDRKNFYSVVHVLNSTSITLPVHVNPDEVFPGKEKRKRKKNAKTIAHPHQKTYYSMYRDHSKWSVNVIYKMKGSFPALLCFYDLNRSSKQTERGGGAFCLNSSLTGSTPSSMKLWEMFMNFQPKPSDLARFKNTDITTIYNQFRTEKNGADDSLAEADFVVDPENEKKKIYELIVRKEETDQILTVPCPFKFRTAGISDFQGQSKDIPSEIPLRIQQIVRQYDIEEINSKLQICRIELKKENSSMRTPLSKDPASAMRFGENTHLVSVDSKKQSHYNVASHYDLFDYMNGGTDTENPNSNRYDIADHAGNFEDSIITPNTTEDLESNVGSKSTDLQKRLFDGGFGFDDFLNSKPKNINNDLDIFNPNNSLKRSRTIGTAKPGNSLNPFRTTSIAKSESSLKRNLRKSLKRNCLGCEISANFGNASKLKARKRSISTSEALPIPLEMRQKQKKVDHNEHDQRWCIPLIVGTNSCYATDLNDSNDSETHNTSFDTLNSTDESVDESTYRSFDTSMDVFDDSDDDNSYDNDEDDEYGTDDEKDDSDIESSNESFTRNSYNSGSSNEDTSIDVPITSNSAESL